MLKTHATILVAWVFIGTLRDSFSMVLNNPGFVSLLSGFGYRKTVANLFVLFLGKIESMKLFL